MGKNELSDNVLYVPSAPAGVCFNLIKTNGPLLGSVCCGKESFLYFIKLYAEY